VLSVACGAYSVVKYQEYQRNKRDNPPGPTGETNLNASKKALNTSIILAVCGAGTLFMALQPMEVKVPIGKIKLSMSPAGASLALNF
jgi:hypothetical protein